MISRGKQEQQAVRKARLAKALRENLKRRKAQARGRAPNEGTGEAAGAGAGAEHKNIPDFRRNRGSE
jgi:hypothetical protein